ncbi:DDE-domain-containing protein [Patellaria atrata CBS 101060]|uniref:DDE-domain-containing protein n=1 Tax=Patellaria atrata CBS 101060 TaxID=1346257 RepID=A0A9P4SEB7_9PEZI|nr:DDE-domain-containing protein [Patellaria atrata CBS 101060]
MVRIYAGEITGKLPSVSWPSRWINDNLGVLKSAYLAPIDVVRKSSESPITWSIFYNILNAKIQQYNIKSHNIYNMDEKGFQIGILGKERRYFSKAAWESGRLKHVIQDGSTAWITLVATICADGTYLPPALIYEAISRDIQDVWLQDYKPKEYNVSFASSPTGWTNNHLGMEWLINVFEPQTKAKARQARDWRLLLVDGYGSHLTLPFVDYCIKHRIILANFPPHSTHKLQPLDVSLFSPLSTYYRQELDKLKSHSEGRYTVIKKDFIRLFLPAFEKAFVPKNILSGFAKTGIQPFNPTAILKIFEEVDVPAGPVDQELSSDEPEISTSDWRTIKRRLKEEFGPTPDLKTQKLSDTLLLAINENQLLKHRIKGLEETLDLEKQKPTIEEQDAIRRQEAASKAEDKVRKEVTKAEKQKELDERRRLRAQDKADRQAKAAAESGVRKENALARLAKQQLNTEIKASRVRKRAPIRAITTTQKPQVVAIDAPQEGGGW